jgi:hypothetical protein
LTPRDTAVAERRLGELPEHQRAESDRDHPQQCHPEPVPGDGLQGALLVGGLRRGAERDAHREHRDERVHDSVRDEPGAADQSDGCVRGLGHR